MKPSPTPFGRLRSRVYCRQSLRWLTLAVVVSVTNAVLLLMLEPVQLLAAANHPTEAQFLWNLVLVGPLITLLNGSVAIGFYRYFRLVQATERGWLRDHPLRQPT